MKENDDLDPELLKAAKKRAIDDGTTLRALVEDRLRERLKKPSAQPEPTGPERATRFQAFMDGWRSEHPGGGPGTDRESIVAARWAVLEERTEHLDQVRRA